MHKTTCHGASELDGVLEYRPSSRSAEHASGAVAAPARRSDSGHLAAMPSKAAVGGEAAAAREEAAAARREAAAAKEAAASELALMRRELASAQSAAADAEAALADAEKVSTRRISFWVLLHRCILKLQRTAMCCSDVRGVSGDCYSAIQELSHIC